MEDAIIRIRDVKKYYQMGSEAIHAYPSGGNPVSAGEIRLR